MRGHINSDTQILLLQLYVTRSSQHSVCDCVYLCVINILQGIHFILHRQVFQDIVGLSAITLIQG